MTSLPPGAVLGPYEILELVGRGGMGEVYRARDSRLGRVVAVKTVAAGMAGDPDRLRRFQTEARAAGAVNHPNVMAVYDVGSDGGVPFVVCELLEGETLRARLRAGPIPAPRAIGYAVQIARGLAAAHEHGVVHRDLKPENVFLTRDGYVKILDFGLAQLAPPPLPGLQDGSGVATATAPGVILGTLGYMAPEQVEGGPLDSRADIFAFGALFHEMLTGRPAFVRETALATLDALLRHDPPPIEAPASLQRLVRHCLEKRPEERFQSARDLAFDLEALAEAPTAALPSSSAALPRRRRRGAVDSLAVLPFVNLGADPAADYLSDGITESVINKLSALPRLKVLARATVFRFKGSDADALHTGRQLGVRAVLTGRVMEVGDRLVIRAELADTADGRQLWGEQYERHPADLLRVQNEMAVEIAASLRLRLTGNQRRRLATRQTEDTRAYRLYLKGRSFLVRRTPASFQEAIRHFEEAVAADPRYALAYSGLADSHCLLERYGVVSPREAMPRARVAADRALELDDSLAEAHCSRALVASYYEWDRPAAMTRFRRALELNPGYATAHHWYGFNLAEWGRTAEAMAEVEAALDLDPLSLIVHANRGTVLYFARRFDEATAQLRRTLDLDATFAVARQWLGRVHEQAGRTDEAIVEHRAALALRGEEPESLANLAHACAIGGRQAEARALLERLLALRGERYVSPYWLAVVYVGLGETEAALRWLEEAAQERFDWMGALGVEPTFDPLRGEARFQELARQVSGG